MNIMVVGVGGQGTLLTSRIIGKTALNQGYDVQLSEVHGMAQRGGSVVTFVRYGETVSADQGSKLGFPALRAPSLSYDHQGSPPSLSLC